MAWCVKAIPLLEAVRQAEPKSLAVQQILRNTYWDQAETLTRLGRHAEALPAWDQTLPLATGASHAEVRLQRALTLAHLGEHARATAEANEVTDQPSLAGRRFYEAACVYGQAVVAAREDARLASADQHPLAQRYAVQAVALLTRAKAAGYFKTRAQLEELKKNAGLKPLHEREDFAKVLATLSESVDDGAR